MKTLNTHRGLPHQISRDNVFDEVIVLYKKKRDNKLAEYPFRVQFKGGLGVDIGGVARDMFSSFYEKAYERLFDGSCLFCPIVHPEMDKDCLSIVGCVISHAYVVTGVLPNQIAFPCLAQCLIGSNVVFDEEILKHSFMDSISVYESNLVKQALVEVHNGVPSFSVQVQDGLVTMFSRFNSRQLPTPSSFHQMTINVAKYEFTTKPAAAISLLNKGIPKQHREFWVNMGVSGLGIDDLRTFLRFTTGSSVCSSMQISIEFNTLSGMSRRPIARTCTPSLVLPTAYSTYEEFVNEFRSYLSNEYTWIMDSI